MAVSCVFTRGQALLAKQMCLQVAAVGTPAGHLAFWLGLAVGYYIPCLAAGSHAARPPSGLLQAGEVLVELFSHGMVSPNGLVGARTAAIYGSFLVPPPPRWRPSGLGTGAKSGAGLWGSGLPPAIVEKMFLLIHNILPLKGWLAAIGVVAEGSCPHCGALETPRHFFQLSPRIADLWDGLYAMLVTLVPRLPSDLELLMLAFPASLASVERCVVAHVATLVMEV